MKKRERIIRKLEELLGEPDVPLEESIRTMTARAEAACLRLGLHDSAAARAEMERVGVDGATIGRVLVGAAGYGQA